MKTSVLVASLTFLIVSISAADNQTVRPNYVIGPGDQISVQVLELPEFGNRPYRVDADGSIGLPMVGRLNAGGLTLSEFESQLSTSLKKQVINPHVVTSISEPRVQPISVMGAVNNPGTQQLQGRKTLFDALAAAGGLRNDAGSVVTVTRQKGEPPLEIANAVQDPTTGRSTASVSLQDVVSLRDSKANIEVRPHDEISIPRAPILYVIGNVRKSGGFTLSEGRAMSALEALSLAEGLAPNAAPKSARILRRTDPTTNNREQIPINLNNILKGKAKDVAMQPDDILFVPDNVSRRITTKTLETALNTVSGVAIWRGF
jgi:polysaccharide export outer membrane protein